ncbi:MAG TPA: hypothetical protein VHM92_09485 [Allosphingosinicella sp.]|nr:hypothetical protein [Allosphingosinicella sp.]
MAERIDPTKDDREIDRRGEELVALLKRKRPADGGPAARKGAPKWAHDLLDWLWPK